VIKKIKQVKKPSPPLRTSQGTWARSNTEKAHAFAEHLANDFSHIPQKMDQKRKMHLYNFWRPPTNSNHQEVINSLTHKKSSGYDLITGKILKELPIIGIKHLTQLLNVVLLKGYFPAQWKVTQIILILKPRKPHELTSYWSISLLPTASKVFEKLLLKRLLQMVENNRLTPNHQFNFRQRHSTIEQTHRIVRRITSNTVLQHF
jgi:hypothetical protein